MVQQCPKHAQRSKQRTNSRACTNSKDWCGLELMHILGGCTYTHVYLNSSACDVENLLYCCYSLERVRRNLKRLWRINVRYFEVYCVQLLWDISWYDKTKKSSCCKINSQRRKFYNFVYKEIQIYLQDFGVNLKSSFKKYLPTYTQINTKLA